ncbi:MAG TPA: cytochrome c biogenesis protein ResB [Pyrinomonadaceae bacterium]|nr:cytochrome c biogenesis protein ResB [Pyrinomonadaceae bacterium]
MSAAKDTIEAKVLARTAIKPALNRVVDFLSSVRFGVSLLIILVVLSIIGMVIIQQNVNGFDSYFASLTPAERTVYTALGLFDIYHSWYYNVLLLILSLNIILASIDRFPTAWAYIGTPKIKATKDWLLNQKVHSSFTISAENEAAGAEQIKRVFESEKFKTVINESETTEYVLDEEGRKDFSNVLRRKQIVVFGEAGKYNRIGAYIVHVALLTLFLGHFVALRTGFDADVRMIPGDESDQIQMIQFNLDKRERFNVQLPFSIETTDIQQKLIDPNGSIDVPNTIDWRTQIKIKDPEYGETVADISLNKPFSYRGYRFFQASAITMGSARNIDVQLTSQSDGSQTTLTIPRNGSAKLGDGTTVEFQEFLPDFVFGAEGKPDTRSGEYNNPVAVLGVTPPGGERTRVFAFAGNIAENIPVGAPKLGYKWRLANYEKSPFAHVLSIKYDPYNGAFIAWYFGGIGLMAALVFVFAFAHRRVWAIIEPNGFGAYAITLGGDTNRNDAAFEERFAKLVGKLEK